jgi:hypothetical protein
MMAKRQMVFWTLVFGTSLAAAFSVLAGELVGSLETEVPTFVYDDHGKRDPFWRLVNAQGVIVNFEKDNATTSSSSDNMALEGIVYEDGGGSVAMINGTIVKVGDAIGSYVVQEIAPHKVILKKGEESLSLELPSEEPQE